MVRPCLSPSIRTIKAFGLSAPLRSFRVSAVMGRQAHIAVIGERGHDGLQKFDSLLPEGAKVVALGSTDQIAEYSKEELEKVDVLLNTGYGANATRPGISKLLPQLPNLKWLAVTSAGVTNVLAPEFVNSDITLTNSKGTFSHSLAEYAITGCLYFAKRITQLQDSQRRSKWEILFVEELRGKTMGIVGYGDIGQRCAKLARVFGMKIIALRRRTELSQEEHNSGLEVYPPDKLNEVMRLSDYLVVTLPSTPATDKFVSKEAISNLKPEAVVINLGRGTTIDEHALIEALTEKKIKGAALDVFEKEPLDEASPLWQLDNVLISPHSADRTTTYIDEALDQFVDNLKLYLQGKDLFNVCDKEQGY